MKMSMKQLVALAITVSVGAGTAAFAQSQREIHEMRTEQRMVEPRNVENVEVVPAGVSEVRETTVIEDENTGVSEIRETTIIQEDVTGVSEVREALQTNVQTAGPLVISSANTIPANTTVTGTLATGLFTENNNKGDTVKVILDHPLVTRTGEIVLPAGSKVLGKVTEVQGSRASYETGMLDIQFDEIETPAGLRLPISGTVASADGKLFSDQLNGVVQVPTASFKGLQADMNSKVGAWYGTELGKQFYYAPKDTVHYQNANLLSPETVKQEIVLGVGDKMQVRFTSPVAVTWMAPQR